MLNRIRDSVCRLIPERPSVRLSAPPDSRKLAPDCIENKAKDCELTEWVFYALATYNQGYSGLSLHPGFGLSPAPLHEYVPPHHQTDRPSLKASCKRRRLLHWCDLDY